MFVQIVFPVVNSATCFTRELYVLMRLNVSFQRSLGYSCFTNITLHIFVDLSIVVLQHECSADFFLAKQTIGLFFLVVLAEVLVETTFSIERFATFETSGNFRSVDAHCVMSVRRLINGQPLKIGIFHFHFTATGMLPTC